jgi:hypothetical protein
MKLTNPAASFTGNAPQDQVKNVRNDCSTLNPCVRRYMGLGFIAGRNGQQ